jgi:hypothetical protein
MHLTWITGCQWRVRTCHWEETECAERGGSRPKLGGGSSRGGEQQGGTLGLQVGAPGSRGMAGDRAPPAASTRQFPQSDHLRGLPLPSKVPRHACLRPKGFPQISVNALLCLGQCLGLVWISFEPALPFSLGGKWSLLRSILGNL